MNELTQNTITGINNVAGKFIMPISIIIGVIVVGIAVTLICVLKSSNKPDKSPPLTPPETAITTGAGEEIIVEIQRQLNQIWIYQGSDIVVTTSTTTLNEPNGLRRNEEKTVNTNYKFLLNIYDENIASDKSKILHGRYSFNKDEYLGFI